MRVFALCALVAASPVAAQDWLRDPASVPLPATMEAQLKLGSDAPYQQLGAAFDALAPSGALPVLGPGVPLRIRAAADRARVFLAYFQYDLDGDGAVTRAEFDTHADITWGGSLGARELAILEEEWAAVDTDADGLATFEEIHTYAAALHPAPEPGPPGPMGEALMGMDLDNDGLVFWDEVEAVLEVRR